MKVSKTVLILTSAVGLAIVVAIVFALVSPGDSQLRGAAMLGLPGLYPPENKKLGGIIITDYHEYRGDAVRWSAAYYGCLFGAAFLSALAGVVLKLEGLQAWPRMRNDGAALAAMVAALLITLSTTGDFQRKWQANRIAAADMENLAYELIIPHTFAELRAVVVEIQRINEARNKGIVGELTDGKEPSRSRALAQPRSAEEPPQVPRR
jgi:hypothetical protein